MLKLGSNNTLLYSFGFSSVNYLTWIAKIQKELAQIQPNDVNLWLGVLMTLIGAISLIIKNYYIALEQKQSYEHKEQKRLEEAEVKKVELELLKQKLDEK